MVSIASASCLSCHFFMRVPTGPVAGASLSVLHICFPCLIRGPSHSPIQTLYLDMFSRGSPSICQFAPFVHRVQVASTLLMTRRRRPRKRDKGEADEQRSNMMTWVWLDLGAKTQNGNGFPLLFPLDQPKKSTLEKSHPTPHSYKSLGTWGRSPILRVGDTTSVGRGSYQDGLGEHVARWCEALARGFFLVLLDKRQKGLIRCTGNEGRAVSNVCCSHFENTDSSKQVRVVAIERSSSSNNAAFCLGEY